MNNEKNEPLVCCIGCQYAVGEKTCVVPFKFLDVCHRLDIRYQKIGLTEGEILSSRLTVKDDRLIPEYFVKTEDFVIPFFEHELNWENRRIFNKRKVFDYRPILKYVCGETVKLLPKIKSPIKVQDDQIKFMNKEVLIEEVILTWKSSFPEYRVSMKYRNKYYSTIISEHLIKHSVNGRWQTENAWCYSCEGFADQTYIYENNSDLPF